MAEVVHDDRGDKGITAVSRRVTRAIEEAEVGEYICRIPKCRQSSRILFRDSELTVVCYRHMNQSRPPQILRGKWTFRRMI